MSMRQRGTAPEEGKEFEELCRQAVCCRYCFQAGWNLSAPTIDIAQPRWFGLDYRNAPRRILVLMLNPGSGEARLDSADQKARNLIVAFRDGRGSLQQILDHQREDMPNWGMGRLLPFYTDRLGLRFDELAFANVAWCATRGNKYPMQMLNECYSRHTSKLLNILKPQTVLLSGEKVHKLAVKIKESLPGVQTINMAHYAHRRGRKFEYQEAEELRTLLQQVGK